MKNKKVVVTGGAGFIGAHIVRALLDDGADVHIIDNFSGGKREGVPQGVEVHEVDIREYEKIAPIVVGARYVFHEAALPRVPFSIEHPQETNAVNINGTLNILIAAKEAGVKRVVYAASSSAYGEQDALPLQEDMPASPKSPYGLQKYVGELYCRVFSDVYDLETVSLRYFNVYGPGLNPDGDYALVIGKFLKQRREGKPLTITGDGEQTRDFTHVRDVVRANFLAASSPHVGRGEVINIGAGNNLSINRLAELIGGPVEHIEARLEPRDTQADNKKAQTLLGWSPEISFEDGIAELKREYGI